MKNLSTWLLISFMGAFWIFRIVIALLYQLAIEFPIIPFNLNMEIILLFVTLICILLIIKRNILGALIYLLSYGMYFGVNLAGDISIMLSSNENLSINIYTSAFISLIGISIPSAVLFDLLLDRNRKNNPKDKKTDWFYKNEKFDRKMDDRADKNNYRTL